MSTNKIIIRHGRIPIIPSIFFSLEKRGVHLVGGVSYDKIDDQGLHIHVDGSAQLDLGFDVIVDGENYTNPFYTECNFCRAQFDVFWKALRNANHLKLTAAGQTVNLPTSNLKELLLPLGAPENSCRSTW